METGGGLLSTLVSKFLQMGGGAGGADPNRSLDYPMWARFVGSVPGSVVRGAGSATEAGRLGTAARSKPRGSLSLLVPGAGRETGGYGYDWSGILAALGPRLR